MFSSWQSLPLHIDPTVFTIFGWPVAWYTLCYIVGIFFATLFFMSLARRQQLFSTEETALELLVSVLWGVLIGARLGYILFYGGTLYWHEPWRIISPYDFDLHAWVGIRGLSFHGGLIGGAIGLWRFSREANRHFWNFSDCLVQALPIGLICGRIGNFLNHEIIGRVTEWPWGMILVPGQEVLRHPVVLYEALGEGVLLFFFLVFINRLHARSGNTTAFFFIGYGWIRFWLEYFREGPTIVGLTTGQLLSVVMVLIGTFILIQRSRQPVVVQ